MKKSILALLCIVCTSFANAQIMEPIFLSDDAEYTTSGYRINDDIVKEIKTYYGIDNFGRVKGFDIQNAFVFTGLGEFSDITDGFMFEFVPKNGGTYGHDTFEAYAKAIWDKCLKAADDGKLVQGFWDGAKVLTFEQSIKVVDKKQDRKKAEWGYIHNGQHRRVQVVERRYKEGAGFSELYVNLKRDI